MDLNHLHLAVDDLAASKAFYQRYFGFHATVVHGRIQFLENSAGFQLALDPAFQPEALPKWFHFGSRLASVADVEALHSKMAAEPERVVRALETHPGHVFFHCQDPDGYRIEVYWEE